MYKQSLIPKIVCPSLEEKRCDAPGKEYNHFTFKALQTHKRLHTKSHNFYLKWHKITFRMWGCTALNIICFFCKGVHTAQPKKG